MRGNDDSLTGNLKSKIAMAGELILIIEDNEKNRKLARDVLQVKGYQTIESETAEDGIDLAWHNRRRLF